MFTICYELAFRSGSRLKLSRLRYPRNAGRSSIAAVADFAALGVQEFATRKTPKASWFSSVFPSIYISSLREGLSCAQMLLKTQQSPFPFWLLSFSRLIILCIFAGNTKFLPKDGNGKTLSCHASVFISCSNYDFLFYTGERYHIIYFSRRKKLSLRSVRTTSQRVSLIFCYDYEKRTVFLFLENFDFCYRQIKIVGKWSLDTYHHYEISDVRRIVISYIIPALANKEPIRWTALYRGITA